jgi:3-hydroxybutyryl-CoA dehydratase
MIDRFVVGQHALLSRTLSADDVLRFADVTGDHNPVHVDPVAAAASPFGGQIVHGMLTASLISAVLGTQLPGPGAIYVSQSLRFLRPVKLGDTVVARVEITAIDPAKRRLTLTTTVHNQAGKAVLDGEATVALPA